MANIFYLLISYCTNYIRSKLHVPRTIFQDIIKKNVNRNKKYLRLTYSREPRLENIIKLQQILVSYSIDIFGYFK